MYSPFQESSSKIYSLAKKAQLEDVLTSLKEPNLKNQDVLKLEDILTLPNLKMYTPPKAILEEVFTLPKAILEDVLALSKEQNFEAVLTLPKETCL